MSSLPPNVVRRIAKDINDIKKQAPDGVKLIINEDDLLDIQAWIQGPGTPYQGGCFRVRLVLDADFPNSPPKGYFVTKIFHPNVSKLGEICVSTLKKDWKKELGLSHVLLTVKCLLIAPNPESALNEEAGRLLLEEYDSFAKHARLFTSIHAVAPTPSPFPKLVETENLDPVVDAFAAKSAEGHPAKVGGVLEEGEHNGQQQQQQPASAMSPNRKRVLETKKVEKPVGTLADKKKSLRRL
ncbi:ubiquitin-conjugating enzyme E2 S [Chytridiales sp. JEL 0842]|nr:ubiquitin-conjugating enzyme E2 S [Chytridiales sp. JEL 0842]